MAAHRVPFSVSGSVLSPIVLALLLLISFSAQAADFAARHLGDYGNVTVMETSGNYDADLPDGTANVVPRQAIANEFFKGHKDEYDFLVIFTNYSFKMPKDAVAFYQGVKNDVSGIGVQTFDNAPLYGSSGRLQGTIDMGSMDGIWTDPLDKHFDFTLGTLAHEMLHRWAVHTRFRDWNGNTSSALIGKDGSHWSYLLDTKGSLEYGSQWQDNGNGTFTAVAARTYYSPLDLYLMGMIDKSQVPPMLLIDNPAVDPTGVPEVGATVSGTPRTVTIDDIIAVEGERIPAAKVAQKQFKIAFIYAVTPGAFDEADIQGIETVRNGFLTRFSVLTDGRGLVQVAATPKDDLPTNPGVHPPTTVPRTLPPNVYDGITWLASRQLADGSWTDFALTTERDTAETVTTLQAFPAVRQQFQAGLQWLGSSVSANTDFLARRLEATIQAGGDGAALTGELLSRRNLDGGWGSGRNFISNPTDTALALKALVRAGYGDQAVLGGIVAYLQTHQQGDGGWSGDDGVSTIQPTAAVLTAFNSCRQRYPLENAIGRAIAFLAGKQNPDGGFGNSPSTVYDSAVAIMALQAAGGDKEPISRGAAYLNGLQTESGSWQASPYQTALAVRAVWQTIVDPDLAIESVDISFIPEKVTSLPTTAVVNAVIRNLGRNDVAQARVAIYDGAVTPDKKVGEQTVAFPGLSPVTVTFPVPVNDGKGHYFHVVVDPDNLVTEANENNNSAIKALLPEATYDFELLAADLTVGPNPVDMYQEVMVGVKIRNRGTADAFNVPVRFFIDDVAPLDIATVTVDIPAGGSAVKKVTWKANRAGVNLPLTVAVDPLNTFTETNKANNRAGVQLTVNTIVLTDPNLSISYGDIVITPNPVNQTESVSVAATVKNDGFADAANIAVEFYKGVPGVDGILLGTQIIPVLKPNESSTVSVPWASITETGDKVIYVKVDPADAIKETNEADNAAFTKLVIQSLADLAVSSNSISFTPHAPKDGEPASIAITVFNKGDLSAANVTVRVSDGGTLLGSQVISAIAGNSQALVSFPFDTTGKSGSHQISVVVEGDATAVEQSTDNNSAVSTLVVYKANMMLSEPYFSPNGDGVKDTTRFSFKLESAQTLTIAIVNKKGEAVRTFSGTEFTNATAGSIVWDGFDDNGKVVDDGEYRIQLKATDGALFNDVLVVVDNNRSSLVDAIQSGNVVSSDMSCMMPASALEYVPNTSLDGYNAQFLKSHTWLPDGSGIVYYLTSGDCNSFYQPCKDLQQDAGVYVVNPDGKTKNRIIPADWVMNNPSITIFPAPDSQKIALLTEVNNIRSLWVVGIDGSNLSLLDSQNMNADSSGTRNYIGHSSYFNNINFKKVIKWSLGGKVISYSGETIGTGGSSNFVIAIDINSKTKLEVLRQASSSYQQFNYEWSPDGSLLAVTSNNAYLATVKLVSKNGEVARILRTYPNHDFYGIYDTENYNHTPIKWLGAQKLFIQAATNYFSSYPYGNWTVTYVSEVIDLNNTVPVITLPGVEGSVLPDGKKIMWKDAHGIYIYDIDTNYQKIIYSTIGSIPALTDIKVSLDSSTISFNQNTDRVVVNIKNGEIKLVDSTGVNNSQWPSYYFIWAQDNNYLFDQIGQDVYLTEVDSSRKIRVAQGNLYNGRVITENIEHFAKPTLDGSGGCTLKTNPSGVQSVWVISAGTNMQAELLTTRQNSKVLLTGTASDINFEGYKIEYALFDQPDQWFPIIPYSDRPVVNNTFGGWIPPGEGSYYIRLTVWDKAGNVASNRQRFSWGQFSQITDLYKSVEVFSPNGDSVKDTVELNYKVLEPLHVTVTVFDQNNAVVRTFARDYAAPIADQITWDGRNESGLVVPDGTYRLRIADYDFSVKVDTSAPDANLTMSRMDRGADPKYFDVSLSGRTFDSNIKQWTVEYGEGDNPQQWIPFRSGTGVLAARDSSNNVIYPIKDTLIETFSNQKIGWLAGKKFRITAEDYAGKKSSAVTGFVEEKIALYQWDGNFVPGDVILPDLAKPGVHSIEAVETVRSPLTSVTLQYSDGVHWFDAKEGEAAESGMLKVSWDNSALNLQKDYLVRIRAKDAVGNEFYSNTLKAALSNKQFKIWPLCSEDSANLALVAENPYESLKKLTFQIKSSQDSRYADWTDFGVIEQPQGFLLPAGQVNPPRPDIKAGMSYTIRMKGTDAGGATYLSNEVVHPSACAVEIGMEVKNAEADCGKTPGATSLSAQIKKLNAGTKTQSLSYYIQKPQELQLLRKIDLSTEQWGPAVLDTSLLAEGSYQVSAVLTFVDPSVDEVKAAGASATVVVDHAAPTSSITYPGASLQLCASSMPTSGGSWFGIPVEGVVADNTKVKRFELLYGVGDNPTSWLPAKTRSGGTLADIKGSSAITGEVGLLDVTDARNTDLSLKLKVVDGAGNASCSTTAFHIKPLPEVRNLVVVTSIFSPNGDGVSDRVSASYSVDGSSTVETKVFQLNKNADGSFALAATPLRTIAASHLLPGGMESAEWDGKNDAGIVVADGMYAIAVSAKDGCSNSSLKWVAVEVDKTLPVSVISSPKAGDALGVLVEVRGSAEDLHFKNYLLEAGEGNYPAAWIAIASGTGQVKENVLGRWNTFGRQGRWTLRLSVEDSTGNRISSSVPLDLPARQTVIKAIDAAPKAFSPNSDGKLESTVISYEVTDASQVKLEILDSIGIVVRDHAMTTASAGIYSYLWDGKSTGGSTVKDGNYNVRLTATLTANSSVSQIETVTVVVDTTSPRLEIVQPANKSFLNKAQIAVSGTVDELNLATYLVSLTGASGTVTLDSGSQPRSAYTFGTLNDLPEGSYTLTMTGKDLAENNTTISSMFTVDRTAPSPSMDSPKNDEYYGSGKNMVTISGTIAETNLERYAVRIGSGTSPSYWQELVSGSTLPASSQLYSWKVGNGDGVADGVYTLSLYAKDKAGAEKDTRVKVTIDNTKPTVSISSPLNGGYLKAPFSMYGTVMDANLDKGTLEMSAGDCAGAFKWAPVKTYSLSFQNGLLESWEKLPADGDYCLRVSALDKVGNESHASITIKVDTRPPAPPVVQGTLENKSEAALQWTAANEPDLAGYNLYRGTEKLNSSLLSQISYRDLNLKEGSYTYVVKAVDLAGNESGPSTAVKLVLDFTPPSARITVPADGARVSGLIDIRGVADSPDDFKQYRIYLGTGANPTGWNLLRSSPVPTSNGVLTQWDTISVAEGVYSIKLEVEDLAGNVNSQRLTVTVDNTVPSKPQLIAATVSGADVSVSWHANNETDVAGYLLYRNDKLANSSGGSLKSNLIAGTSYVDRAVLDGKSNYYLIAMDQAGNLSDQSNSLIANVDSRPPHVTIDSPKSTVTISDSDQVFISGSSPDSDIASVQFQYKKLSGSVWTNFGSAITSAPYTIYFDPKGLGLPYDYYKVQPVATDNGGRTDPAPAVFNVTYTDLTPPSAPMGLKAVTVGKDVSLTWTANTEQDLKGYYVYRTISTSKSQLNYTPINASTYRDTSVPNDGLYTYEVVAVDTYNNKSIPSVSVSAKIYTPFLVQPFSPANQASLPLQGSADANATVEITNQTASGDFQSVLVADSQGKFTAPLTLALGENRITAKGIDSLGNVSKSSAEIAVVYNEAPAVPTGLMPAVQGDSVALSWNANQEADLAGYNLFRDGEKVNKAVAVTQGTAGCSSYDSYYSQWQNTYFRYPPVNAFDGNPGTYWASAKGAGTNFGPEYWQLQLPASELISGMQIDWGVTTDVSGKETLYGGKDYEVQAWTGTAWVTLAKVTGNSVKVNTLEFKPSYATSMIRIYVTATNDPNTTSRQVWIADVKLFKDGLIKTTAFQDTNLKDHKYLYRITAVDNYGFESGRSPEAVANVGDVLPPATPEGLTASVSGTTVTLAWVPASSEADLAGYNVYRSSGQGWDKLTTAVISAPSYTDANLKNGSYGYRVTALDLVGNESAPSGEAAATVSTALPPTPANLRVTVVPQGSTLRVEWDVVGGVAVSYNLYRSTVAGGLYTRIVSLPASSSFFADGGLSNGSTYYYYVASVDPHGNESLPSLEASGTAKDTIPPAMPIPTFPTTFGTRVLTYDSTTDIAGMADPDVNIELFNGGPSLGSATPVETVDAMKLSLDYSGSYATVSPNGNALAYMSNSSQLVLQDLVGATKTIAEYGYSPVWNTTGTTLAYLYRDANWQYRLGVYDLATGASSQVTTDTYTNESSPSWSADGKKLAFINSRSGYPDIYLKNIEAGSLTKLTNWINAYNPMISPDGTSVAYFEYSTLKSVDGSTGTITQIDTSAMSSSQIAWSPDGRKLAFISTRNGYQNLYSFDTTTKTVTALTNTTNGKPGPVAWSPDGGSVAYIRSESDGTLALWLSDTSGNNRSVLQKLSGLKELKWKKNGELLYVDGYGVHTVFLSRHFIFKGIPLNPGENIFYARASDPSGNVTDYSDEIRITYDTSKVPDVSVTADDIFVYPPFPKPGEDVAVNVLVRNNRNVSMQNIDVDIYAWDTVGDLTLLKSQTIALLPANYASELSMSLNAGFSVGAESIIVVVDGSNKISELNEDNNYASAEFYVTDKEEVVVTASTDGAEYASNSDAVMTVTVGNSGAAREGSLTVGIEDADGNCVAALGTTVLVASYGAGDRYSYNWNTADTFAGSYRVHAVFTATDGTVTESSVPFAILPEIRIESAVSTDRLGYGANDGVTVTVSLKNSGSNYTVPQLKARVRIVDVNDATPFSDEKEVRNLVPAMGTSVLVHWDTGLSLPGAYRVVAETYLGDTLVSSSLATFAINPVSNLSGTVAVDAPAISIGSSLKASFSVTNSGNSGASGSLRALVVNPEDGTILATVEQAVTLAVNGSQSGTFTFPTDGLELKQYLLSLQYSSSGMKKNIASISFTVKDGTPPTVTVVSPLVGTSHNTTIPIVTLVSDNASGVDKVEYQLDGGAWKILPCADPATGRYAGAWEPTITDNGPHTVGFRSIDRAGNMGSTAPVGFNVQMDSTPPLTTLSVGAPQYTANDKLYISPATLFTLTATDDYSGVARTEYHVDDGQWLVTSSFAISAEGEHILYYRSVDKAGNGESEIYQQVIVDSSPPMTSLAASDPLTTGEVNTVSPYTIFTLAAADNLSGVKGIWYRIDDGPWNLFADGFALSGLKAGTHTIYYSASDNVGNAETEHSLTVCLILAEISKHVAPEPVVLVGGWGAGTGDKLQSSLDTVRQVLSSLGLSYHIAVNDDDFKQAFRSGRYTTYILMDYKDEKLGREIRETINYGDSLIFIKTQPTADPVLDELFGVKFTGKTTSETLPVNLLESPISSAGTLQSSGKVVIGVVPATTTQLFGQVDDKHNLYPAILFNQYGQGKVILYSFDVMGSPDQGSVASLLGNSLRFLQPAQHAVRALDSVPVKIAVSGSTEPIRLQIKEFLPDGTSVDTVAPQGTASDKTILWLQDLGAATGADFGYYLNLPDAKGEYTVRTDVMYANHGDYRLYSTSQLTATARNSSVNLLQAIRAGLNSFPVAGSNDLVILNDLLSRLSRISTDPVDLKEAENGVEDVAIVAGMIRVLSSDADSIRVQLNELLKILERKWYLLYMQQLISKESGTSRSTFGRGVSD